MPGPQRLDLSSDRAAPAIARKAVLALLFKRGRRTSIPMVELVVSEMVTNAVLHAEGPLQMQLTVEGDRLRVEVSDGSPERPLVRRIPGPNGGYGLPMIDSLSEVWGTTHCEGRKVVWAELDLTVAQEW